MNSQARIVRLRSKFRARLLFALSVLLPVAPAASVCQAQSPAEGWQQSLDAYRATRLSPGSGQVAIRANPHLSGNPRLAAGSNFSPSPMRSSQMALASLRQAVPDMQAPLVDLPHAQADSTYSQLNGHTIACRAAQNWSPANALRAHGRTIVQAYCEEDACSQKAAAAINKFLHLQAAHQEDVAGASGLRAYYSRIGIVEQFTLLDASVALVDQEQEKQRALVSSGLSVEFDLSSFQRQRIDLKDKSAQAQSQDRQLASLIAHLTKLPTENTLLTHESLDILPQSLDCQGLIEFGMQNRHDLQSWIYLRCQITDETAPIIAKMLSTAVGGFGLPLPTISGIKQLLCGDDNSRLAANMRNELAYVIQTHRDWIRGTVDEKCHKLELAYQRVQFAQETLASWESRLAQLDRVEQLGEGQPQQAAAARAALIQAKVDELNRRLEAKLAEVELAEACGGLANRCCQQTPWLVTGY